MKDILDLIAVVCRRSRVEPYLVGGSVRDRLLNVESHDWDLVCIKAHAVAAAVARRLSRKLITLDEQHRIYRIVLPSKDGQRAITLDFAEQQGKTLRDDLGRRDFTINAMASPLDSSEVIDPFGGQKDLKKKIVRALSRKAFQEDPLRLLRAYRMAAQFGLVIEPQTARWLKLENARLGETRGVARERVREELLRLLGQRRSAEILGEMDRSGVLTTIFPELEAGRQVGLDYYGKGGVIKHHLQSVANVEHILETIETGRPGFVTNLEVVRKMQTYVRQPVGSWPRSAFLKLGALVHDIGKPATAQKIHGRLRFFGHEDVGARIAQKLLSTLRFSRQEGSLIRTWVQNHMRPGNLASAPQVTEKAVARFFRDMGEDGVGMLIVSLGDHYTYLARTKWGKGSDVVERTSRRLLEDYYLKQEKVLPPRILDGNVLMKKLRLKPGPLIGKLLEAVRDAQSEGKVKTAEEALRIVRQSVKRLTAETKNEKRNQQ